MNWNSQTLILGDYTGNKKAACIWTLQYNYMYLLLLIASGLSQINTKKKFFCRKLVYYNFSKTVWLRIKQVICASELISKFSINKIFHENLRSWADSKRVLFKFYVTTCSIQFAHWTGSLTTETWSTFAIKVSSDFAFISPCRLYLVLFLWIVTVIHGRKCVSYICKICQLMSGCAVSTSWPMLKHFVICQFSTHKRTLYIMIQ